MLEECDDGFRDTLTAFLNTETGVCQILGNQSVEPVLGFFCPEFA
jgi:hypothetical protein